MAILNDNDILAILDNQGIVYPEHQRPHYEYLQCFPERVIGQHFVERLHR